MGHVLDGFSEHMKDYNDRSTFLLSGMSEPDQQQVVEVLKESGAEILVHYLPVGSEEATRFYVECALEAGLAFINNIPVFIASDPIWAKKFENAGLPIIGDDIKAQLGATVVHRTLTDLFRKRGLTLNRTYQLNYRREYRFPEHAEPSPASIEKDIENRGRSIGGFRTSRPGKHPCRSQRLRPVAKRQQDLLYPHGRQPVR
jgi:myo-inositol-1-phosphate synthase